MQVNIIATFTLYITVHIYIKAYASSLTKCNSIYLTLGAVHKYTVWQHILGEFEICIPLPMLVFPFLTT